MRKACQPILAAAVLMWAGSAALAVDPGIEAARPVKQAENRFSQVHAKLCNAHPLSGELQEARRDFSKAYRKLELIRREIKEEVESLPEVHQIDLQIRILYESIRPSDDINKRTEMASELLELRRAKSKFIAAASEGDNKLTIAQADLEDASRHLREVEDQYAMVLRSDPAFTAAKEQLVSARKSIPTLSYAIGG